MSARTWVVGGSLVAVLAVNGYLLFQEEKNYFSKLQTTAEGRVLAGETDPLLGLRFSSSQRETNFLAFGLDEAQTAEAMKRLRDYEDRYTDRIKFLFENAGDRESLEQALCGQAGVRPRYGALRFLVEEQKDGSRRPINLQRATKLEWQEWSKAAPIGAVYAEVELADERKEDATRMGIAAILAGREQDVLEKNSPWGPGLTQRWSFSAVTEEVPGIEDKLLKYFAAMHLVVELATDEAGICAGA
jgi:hypothetical protein